MIVELKKVSPTHHAFTMVFANGGKETIQLETKTFLYHDLLHFAVESEAHLQHSFYGKLAKGQHYEDLQLPEMSVISGGGEDESLMTERIVGVMTGVLKGGKGGEEAMGALHNLLSASGEEVPEWFTPDFVGRVKERMRTLEGAWKGTPFGSAMKLVFEVSV